MSKLPVAPRVAADRVRKLLRIVQELELALELAREMPNDFLKRTMARHVVVRTENFIAHHQRLVSTASLSGRDEPKRSARYFAEQFDALGFAETRHKYGAHVQDLEYGFDVDFWQNVDNRGLKFFVDGARELYGGLGDVGVPEFVEYEPLHETSNAALKESLREFASENPLDARFRFGTDPLAFVRPGTGAMINAHPLHVRAGRLALIRLWMRWQLKLEPFLSHFTDSKRILRARMVTDVVSFCDSLVSRTSSKHVEALDELLRTCAASAKDRACAEGLGVVTRFLGSFAFGTRTDELRIPRNKYGAHLEIGDETSLVQVVQAFDALDFAEAVSFFRVLERVFENTCRATHFLTGHMIGDEPLAGISSDTETDRGEPFERGRPDIVVEPARPALLQDDDDTLNQALDLWLASSEEQARTVWWHAFTSSEIVECIRIGKHSGGYVHVVELRRAHQVIRERLKHATHAEAVAIIRLLEACKRGDPQPLIPLVLEYARSSSPKLSKTELAMALGGLASWRDEEAREYVSECAKNAENSCDRVLLARAVCKLFIQAEYFGRLNEKRIGVDFETEVRSTADGLRPVERAIVFAAFASDFAWGDLSGAQEGGPFHDDYVNSCQALRKECEGLSGGEQCALAIEQGDFVAVCLLLQGYTKCDADAALCVWAAAKAVTCSRGPEALLNLALALGLAGEVIGARSLVAEAARQNPESTDILVECVRTAAQILGGRPLVEELVANLNKNYKLTVAQKTVLDACAS